MGRKHGSARRAMRRFVAVISAAALVPLVVAVGAETAGAATATITSDGPLTAVGISDQLNCSVNHAGDTSPEFYSGTACGTFAAVDGTMYFSPASIPAGQPSATPWTVVSQTGPTGTGTNADPFKIVTVVDAGTTGVRLTQTDTYTTGLESYRTDIAVDNTSATEHTVRLYRAADCFLQNSDVGFGQVDTATGAVACATSTDPGSRIEQWFPLTAGSRYMEANFSTVWSQIASLQQFPNTCLCDSSTDNGAGLQWDLTVAPSDSTTVSSLITFSPLGIVPLSLAKTADSGSVAPGGADGYTITATNPNAGAVTLATLTDTLPAGFSYTAGSTTGATTANPTVNGQNLTWSGISVPGNGTATLHFGVTAASAPGTYTNEAAGTASEVTVAPTGPTAPVTVTGTENPLVLDLSPSTSTNPVGADHTVTATATRDGAEQAGVTVTFTVVDGPNTGTTGTATTNDDGQASFTYTSSTDGTDTIRASALDGDVTVTSNDVTKTWTPVVTTGLDVTNTSEPATVSAGQTVLQTFTVTNGTEVDATSSTLNVTFPAGATVESSDPSQGTCTAGPASLSCALGTIPGAGSATVPVVVTVPAGFAPGPFTPTATASSDQSGTSEFGDLTGSQVVASGNGQAFGFVPPGGSITTGDASAQFPTAATFTLPNIGSGSPISLTTDPTPPGFCGGQTCRGRLLTLSPFSGGYTDPRHPPVLDISLDKTVVRRFGPAFRVWVQKEDSTAAPVLVPDCRSLRFGGHFWWHHHWWFFHRGARVANPSPCVSKRYFDRHGDSHVEILILQGDPKFARR